MRVVGGLYIPKILLREAFRKRNHTILNDGSATTGKKICAVSKDLDVEEVKTMSKKNEVSINDFLSTIVGMTFREYLDIYDKERTKDLKTLNMSIPISLRYNTVKSLEEVEICNKFTVIPVDLRLDRKFEDNMKETKKIYKKIKGSFEYYGSYVLCNVSGFFAPAKLSQVIME